MWNTAIKMGGMVSLSSYLLFKKKDQKVKCCGIIGYISEKDNNAWEVLTQGINLLSNRGYDSAGISTI